MSVPHSTILSCSRGVLAKTDVGYCSPKQSQNSSSYAENNVKVQQRIQMKLKKDQWCKVP